MARKVIACLLALGVALPLVVSCRVTQESRKPEDGALPDITPTTIDYVDGDGFDAVFETALTSQDPVIVVRTGRPKPDWTGRLNAWVAAWNRGGDRPRPRTTARGQAPLGKLPLDGESIRELRLLVGGLLDRVEELAQSGAAWWAEERVRARRVALLKPYSLRFHMDEEGLIQLVFFHGGYSAYYPRFLQVLTRSSGRPGGQEWTRGVECSMCERKGHAPARLTSRAGKD